MENHLSRIQYIDALRGVAILTVVYSHILIFCMVHYPQSFITELLRLFYLNGFFFISGYLFYKPINTFTTKRVKDILSKKTILILIPTIVFGTAYFISHGIGMTVAIFDEAKMGYWFTFVLYEMFIIAILLMFVFNKIKYRKLLELPLLIVISVLSFCLVRFGSNEVWALRIFSPYNFMFYLPMFVLGMLCKKFNLQFQRLLASRVALAVLFCLVLLSFYIRIPSFIISVSIVFFAFCFGYQTQKSTPGFFEQNVIGRYLSLFGRYSMEIYFIHYFLLFELPVGLSEYFARLSVSNRSLSFPEFIVVGTLATIICFASIAIAVFLRRIPYVGKLALGK